MRLSTRIALWAAAVVPLLVLLAGLLLLPLVGRDLRHQQDARLAERAAAVLPSARTLVAADTQGRPKAEQNQQRKVLDAALDSGVRVTAPDGTVLLAGGPQPADDRAFPTTPGGPVTVRDHGTAWRVLTVRVPGGEAGSGGTLWVSESGGLAGSQTATVRRRVLFVAALAAPISALIGFVLAERATAPLRRLSRRASELDPAASPGDGDGDGDGGPGGGGEPRVGRPGAAARFAAERSGTAEVDELATALALLLSRYDEQALRTVQALETARSFSAAASHELRTPLMSLGTNLDVLAAHHDLPPAERAEIVAELRDDHARLLDLLTALGTLARGDLVEVDSFGPVDLAELADAAAAEVRRRHPAADFTVELPPELRLFGWEAGLRMLLVNLLVNAAVHGRGGAERTEPARVTVRLAPAGTLALLTVDDTGPGVPAGEREAVFHRFHRRRDSPGSGLGLTLVAQQAALHRGTVRITEPPGGRGCRVEVRLPRPDADAPTLRLPARRDWIAGGEH
ncbi:HAMP domain-containing sensor histidine kinase [Streptomyces sp. SP17BM10]|uniref:sensor histidine kinase n=1 Tax=Streptomyces sp. SP17BM10 TaxID=3002530 RepID=UPI002E7848AD|nr:HAMP domain-containing sensor histidine kinase [Streptomyces sp. SP17BM10]MEE1782176.1 HAMP domain-containing sensor histidine kinase [Streptomyces sp. SP17BM10]